MGLPDAGGQELFLIVPFLRPSDETRIQNREETGADKLKPAKRFVEPGRLIKRLKPGGGNRWVHGKNERF